MKRDGVLPVPKSPPLEKQPKPLRARSTKTADRDARYAIERDEFLSEFPLCAAHWDATCTEKSEQVHHMGGRAPSVFFRKAWWLPVCGHCHHEITHHPDLARERGLSFHTSTSEPQ